MAQITRRPGVLASQDRAAAELCQMPDGHGEDAMTLSRALVGWGKGRVCGVVRGVLSRERKCH